MNKGRIHPELETLHNHSKYKSILENGVIDKMKQFSRRSSIFFNDDDLKTIVSESELYPVDLGGRTFSTDNKCDSATDVHPVK